jgi:hypothetical protein
VNRAQTAAADLEKAKAMLDKIWRRSDPEYDKFGDDVGRSTEADLAQALKATGGG